MFDPFAYIRALADVYDVKALDEDTFWQDSQLYGEKLYPDTIQTLRRLQDGYTLGIFSQGNTAFQHMKLRYTLLRDFFSSDTIFISEDKTNSAFVRQLPSNSVIIDNDRTIIQKLSVPKIWLNRSHVDDIEGSPQIHSLVELFE